MEIILSEKDLTNAVKLYMAHSGVVRTVTSVEFARKLKGDDAGISVAMELSDVDLTPEMLAELALTQQQARGLNAAGTTGSPNSAIVLGKGKAAKSTSSAGLSPGKPAEHPSDADTDEELGAASVEVADANPGSAEDPFGDFTDDADPAESGEESAETETETEIDAEAKAIAEELEATDESTLGNDVPEGSPFSTDEVAESISEEDDIGGVDFNAPEPKAEDDPFGDIDDDDDDDAPVVPAGEEVKPAAAADDAEDIFG